MFIHEAVLEALLCGDTSVMAQDLAAHYDDLITVDMQTHFAPIQEEFEVSILCFGKWSFQATSIGCILPQMILLYVMAC